MSAWSLLVDEASGAPYYFDAATEQSHWAATDHEGGMVKTDAASGHEYLLHAETGATRWCEPPESQQCVWEELKDPGTGAHYFYSNANGQAQWRAPPWIDYIDTHSGFLYYYSPERDESCWERPADFQENAREDEVISLVEGEGESAVASAPTAAAQVRAALVAAQSLRVAQAPGEGEGALCIGGLRSIPSMSSIVVRPAAEAGGDDAALPAPTPRLVPAPSAVSAGKQPHGAPPPTPPRGGGADQLVPVSYSAKKRPKTAPPENLVGRSPQRVKSSGAPPPSVQPPPQQQQLMSKTFGGADASPAKVGQKQLMSKTCSWGASPAKSARLSARDTARSSASDGFLFVEDE